MGNWIDQVLDHDRTMARRDGQPAPDDELRRLLEARAQLVERVREADRIITGYMLSRLLMRLHGGGGVGPDPTLLS